MIESCIPVDNMHIELMIKVSVYNPLHCITKDKKKVITNILYYNIHTYFFLFQLALLRTQER